MPHDTNGATAMSKRIPTDQGGRRGPQSSNRDRDAADHAGGQDRNRRRDRYRDREDDRPGSSSGNPNNMPLPFPNMMGMNMGNMAGMNLPTMPNGMPMLPPGFPFPFPQQQNQNQDQNGQQMEQ